MKIRSAIISDAGAIAAFWGPMIRDTHVTFEHTAKSAPDVAAMITDCGASGYAFLVAEDAGRIVGFATYRQFRAGAGYAHTMEHTIIVAPRGRTGASGALCWALWRIMRATLACIR